MKDNRHVYVIDDDEGIRDILKSMLEQESYEVNAFENGKDAISKMKQNNPAMILLDYYLPGEKAENIVKDVKNIKRDVPIVLMSANLTLLQSIEKIGAEEFMEKPFSRDALLQVVTKYVH